MAALAFAQRHLVGNLENIAQRLGALAVKPAHGQAELVHRLDDRIDLLRQHQSRQVQHRAHADARAEIRRARGQIAEFLAERVIRGFSPVRNPTGQSRCHACAICRPGRSACIRR